MQKYSGINTQSILSWFKAGLCVGYRYFGSSLLVTILVASIGGGLSSLKVRAAEITNTDIGVISQVGNNGERLVVQDCAPATGFTTIIPVPVPIASPNENTEVGPCGGKDRIIMYNCKLVGKEVTTNIDVTSNFTTGVFCQSQIGNTTNQEQIRQCVTLGNRGLGTWSARVLIETEGSSKEDCAKIIAPFCSHMLNLTSNRNSGRSLEYCEKIGYTNANKPNIVGVTNSNNTATVCKVPSAAQLEEIKGKLGKDTTFDEKNACLDDAGSLFYCLSSSSSGEKGDCVAINAAAKATQQTVGVSGSDGGGNALGGLFSILYKVVLVILLIVLILIEYIQMIILTIMAYVISALLDLSPSAPILTSIGLPLWQIFANLANFLVIGFMVYVGAATMVGVMKTEQAGKNLVTISVLALLLNTTYFFLNFVISTVDGFANLLISVFVGNGGLFGLFTGMFGLFSKVSVLRDGQGAIDVSSPISAVGNFSNTLKTAVGTASTQFVANDNGAALTFTFLGEALVVISFFIILLIFKDTFVLVFARVTILLLLLITSPVWVVAFFLKDIFKSSQISGALSKLPSQLFGTILFNFAMVLGVIITVLITGKAQDGFKGYILDVGKGGGTIAATAADSANFLSPNGASLIIAGVVPVFLGVSVLYFINQAFKGLFPLLDQIGTQVGNGAADFAKGIISGDIKGGITKFAKGATTLATGGGQLENVATLAPKLALKGGVMLAGAPTTAITAATGLVAGGAKLVGQAGLAEKIKNNKINKGAQAVNQFIANQEEQRLRPLMNDGGVADLIGSKVGTLIGKDSTTQQIATRRAKYVDDQKKKGQENEINKGLTEEERKWNNSRFGGGRDVISQNARDDEDLENAKGQTTADKSKIETQAREAYYDSAAGQDALKARNLAENQLEQLKTIADNLKSGQESANKATYMQSGDPEIARATKSTLQTELQKGIDTSNIDNVKSGLESAFYDDMSNANLIQNNANAKLSEETNKRTVAGKRGAIEEIGKQIYNRSAQGQVAIRDAVISEKALEQERIITDSNKKITETGATADYYENPSNQGNIQEALRVKTNSEIIDKIGTARVGTVNSRLQADVYNSGGAGSLYNSLADYKFGVGGQKEMQDRENEEQKNASSVYQTQEDAYEDDKAEKDKNKQTKLKRLAVKSGRDFVGTPVPNSVDARNVDRYKTEKRAWRVQLSEFEEYKKNAPTQPEKDAWQVEIDSHMLDDPDNIANY